MTGPTSNALIYYFDANCMSAPSDKVAYSARFVSLLVSSLMVPTHLAMGISAAKQAFEAIHRGSALPYSAFAAFELALQVPLLTYFAWKVYCWKQDPSEHSDLLLIVSSAWPTCNVLGGICLPGFLTKRKDFLLSPVTIIVAITILMGLKTQHVFILLPVTVLAFAFLDWLSMLSMQQISQAAPNTSLLPPVLSFVCHLCTRGLVITSLGCLTLICVSCAVNSSGKAVEKAASVMSSLATGASPLQTSPSSKKADSAESHVKLPFESLFDLQYPKWSRSLF